MNRFQINPNANAARPPFDFLLSDELKLLANVFTTNDGGDLLIICEAREALQRKFDKLLGMAHQYESTISRHEWNERARVDRHFNDRQKDDALLAELAKPDSNVILLGGEFGEVPISDGGE